MKVREDDDAGDWMGEGVERCGQEEENKLQPLEYKCKNKKRSIRTEQRRTVRIRHSNTI